MDAIVENGTSPVSKQQIQPEYGEWAGDDAGRNGRTRPVRPTSQAQMGTETQHFSLFS